MKKLLIILAIVLMASVAWADPFLVCDDPNPSEQVTSYEIFKDGVSIGTTPAPLHFDLDGITPGIYNFTAIAINAWGSSSPSNPYVSPATAATPNGLTME